MQLQFSSFPVVVVSSTSMTRHFLKIHDLVFAGRPKTAADDYTTYNYSDNHVVAMWTLLESAT
ncbi:hypothetical protein IEQ34_016684 [Dendrobium chrysotoxum]|uniref:Uncharacterized protein n=1 Tax=Dendrobium chrysotoxum TaxID=161865 RepID=A0AAV7GG98_DENCH|nr:hypothetical protein IEQ34_016684 [Dendrobium chrysotoxum]